MTRTVLITGASSGIGKATAELFAVRGWNVAATMRSPEAGADLARLDNVLVARLDVTEPASAESALAEAIAAFGRIDVVVNNAGYGLWGPFEAATEAQVRRQFEVNVLGLMTVTRAALPHFREMGGGRFVNIASIGGQIAFPLVSVYHGTKWAVEGFSESLSFELGDIGISVKIVEPGVIETEFQGRSLDWAAREGLDAYDGTIAKFQRAMEGMNQASSPASLVAETVWEAAHDASSRLRFLCGADAEQMFAGRRQAGDEAFVEGIRAQTLGPRADAESA